MSYEIRRAPLARKDIRDFIRYLKREAGEAAARRYFEALEHDITRHLADNPHAFPWFRETGPPYRAKLFKLARTTYWIVYAIDDEKKIIELVRFWNSAREPRTHGL